MISLTYEAISAIFCFLKLKVCTLIDSLKVVEFIQNIPLNNFFVCFGDLLNF